jgi:hypothetical protein
MTLLDPPTLAEITRIASEIADEKNNAARTQSRLGKWSHWRCVRERNCSLYLAPEAAQCVCES